MLSIALIDIKVVIFDESQLKNTYNKQIYEKKFVITCAGGVICGTLAKALEKEGIK